MVVRYKNIDGLRGIAVLMVITFHFINNSYMSSNIFELNSTEKVFMKLTSFGWAGVNLFFILSGFLIGYILLENKKSSNYFKVFYLRRFFRIIPLYYSFIIIYLIIEYFFNNNPTPLFEKPISIFYYLFLVQNFLFSSLGHFGPSALTPTWSLAIEEQFYIIIPLLIYILSTKRLIQICILFIIISPIFRSNASNWYMEYTHLIGRVDTLFLGVVLAVMKKEEPNYLKIFYSKYFIFFLFVTLLSIYLFVSKSINHSIISFGFFYIVLFTFDNNQNKIISKLLFSPILSFVGKLSFFIYLFHQLINGLFFYTLQNGQAPNLNSFQSYLIGIMSISFTFYLAYMSANYYEGRFIKYGQKFKFSK